MAAKAAAHGAQAWLAGLPEIVAGLERDWGFAAGTVFGDATEALVTGAVLADGTPAVLKVHVPRDGGRPARSEITVLRLAGGQGCARLLRADAERGALLVERLGPSMHDLGLPLRRRQEALCAAARRVWRAAPGCGLPDGAAAGRRLAAEITAAWERLGRPCPERAVAYAVECAERRAAAHDAERAVLNHGDVHEWNALAAGDGFALVDPSGWLAEPEYDLGALMREDPADLLAGDMRERSRWLARHCGLDERAIWEWGAASRVAVGLELTEVGVQPAAGEMLAAAERAPGAG